VIYMSEEKSMKSVWSRKKIYWPRLKFNRLLMKLLIYVPIIPPIPK